MSSTQVETTNTHPYHVLDHLSIIFVIVILVSQHLIERVAAWLHLALSTSRSAWQSTGPAHAAFSTTSSSAVTVNYLKQRVWCGIHFIRHWDELIRLSFPPPVSKSTSSPIHVIIWKYVRSEWCLVASSVDGRRSVVTNDTSDTTFCVKMVWRNTLSTKQ